MEIVVIGGSGLICSRLVAKLNAQGQTAVAASPSNGVNTLTGEGLAEILEGASVVVDLSNSPSFEAAAVMEFFTTSTRTLLEYDVRGGVTHHRALSVVGTARSQDRVHHKPPSSKSAARNSLSSTNSFALVCRRAIVDDDVSGVARRERHILSRRFRLIV